MSLTPAQIVDIEQTIMGVIDPLKESDRQKLIQYLLSPSKENQKNLSHEAREAFQELLEDRLLDANMWLQNRIFMGKSEGALPTVKEVADVINAKLISQSSQKRDDKSPLKRSCTQQLSSKKGQTTDQSQFIDSTLLEAAYKGNLGTIQQAIENGLDINKTYPPYGGTLLSYAANGGSLEMVDVLLDHGAEPNIVDKNNNLPLAWAILNLKPAGGAQSRSADVSEPVTSPEQYINIAKRLLIAGSRVDVKDKKGQSPLDLIQEDKNTEIVRLKEDMEKNEAQVDQIEQALSNLDKIDKIDFQQIIVQLRSIDPTVPKNADLLKTATEMAIKQKKFEVAKTLLNIPHNDLLKKSSEGEYSSILTVTLEQAFYSRYTEKHREAFLDFAKYLLIRGAKASEHDGEILDNFFPLIPYDVLKLTNFKSKFSDFDVSSVTKYDAEQAKAQLDEKTGLEWKVVFEKNNFVLKHTKLLHSMEYDDRVDKIIKEYGAHQLAVQTASVGRGMMTSKVTLTIPTAVIPQINQKNFSQLLNVEEQRKALSKELADKEKRERIRQKQLRDAKRELNLLRTKDIAEETYRHLNELMPKQWKMRADQNGYELHYDIGFRQQKEEFEKNGGLKETIKNMLGVDLKPEEYILGRGTHAWELVLRSPDMKKISIASQAQPDTSQQKRDERIEEIWKIKETQDPNNKPNAYEVSKLLAANPTNINKQFAYKGASPLSLAVTDGDIDTVKALLDLGADPNLPDAKGNTPLAWAILKTLDMPEYRYRDADYSSAKKEEKYRQIAFLLVQKRANLDSKDEHGNIVRHMIATFHPSWEQDISNFEQETKPKKAQNIEEVVKPEEQVKPPEEGDISIILASTNKLTFEDTLEKLELPFDTTEDMPETKKAVNRFNQLKAAVAHSISELKTSSAKDEQRDEQIDRISRIVIGMEAISGELANIDDAGALEKFKTTLADFRSEVVFSSPMEEMFVSLLLWIEENILPESVKIAPGDAESKFRFFKPPFDDIVKQKAFDLSEDIEEKIKKGPGSGK